MSAHFYTQDELAAANREKLDIIAEARGITPDGTGAGGNVTMEDLRVAIATEQDRTGVNPGLVAEPEEVEVVHVVVTGGAPVNGYVAGETFSTYMTPQTKALIDGGAIRIAENEPSTLGTGTLVEITEPDGSEEPSEDTPTEES